MTTTPVSPWYREPWPWLVMAPLAAVVVAGVATIWLAVATSDGVVADDYYKQGLGINRTLQREARAAELGIEPRIMMNAERTGVRVLVASTAPLPETLRLTLVHPTRRDGDQAVELRHIGGALYEGRLQPPRAARWRLTLEDGAGTWRVSRQWSGTD